MNNHNIGTPIQQPQGYKAFIPARFPPQSGFQFANSTIKKASQATLLLGKLDGITKLLPDLDFFLLMYLRKDATASSQIEGTQATMIDAIEAEVQTKTNLPKDVDDIIHYIKALRYGIKRAQVDNFPFSLRFIRELHKELMSRARATHYPDPGEFRKSQNWIGGTKPDNAKFVPPPVTSMHQALDNFEKYIYQEDSLLTIIKAGILHAQFETIHPFLDGNGRTGRMLITFFLWHEHFLENPVLFLSAFFKKHQELYYEKLTHYHQGNVQSWIEFFLDGVIEIADEAIVTVDKITNLREKDMMKIHQLGKRASESAVILMPKLYGQPIINVPLVQKWTGFTWRGAMTVIDRFIKMGILMPKDKDVKYGQSYVYRSYLEIFATRE
ncbi:MAG: Filamentation induced by cAMP protein Fic [uncultured bacterium]|nr:MAG: Filamentation induced by cAMP protein Fic [uncultured bacterium]